MEISNGTFIIFQRYKKCNILIPSRAYQRDPEEFAGTSHAQKRFADVFLQKLTFKKTDRILDLSCWDKIITNELAEKVPDGYVVGVDISPDMVQFASSHSMKLKIIFFHLLTSTYRYFP